MRFALPKRHGLLAAAAFLTCTATATRTFAQTYPVKPITVVIQ